ncbi:chromosome undetermined scaffold_21, whole genome shotgun sequence [Paenibacillus sp. NAIST15-1]|nr:chromosome undetermined scaffold_21, whole genome shotgun sequence [Paenibacillus sp. NAIST15-1]
MDRLNEGMWESCLCETWESSNGQLLRIREHLREMRFYIEGVKLDFLNKFLYAIACIFVKEHETVWVQ